MTDQPYTPSLSEVKRDYLRLNPFGSEVFDRMIEAVRAEERERAAQIAESWFPKVDIPHYIRRIAHQIRTQGKEQDR